MLLWVMVVGFENTSAISGKQNVSRVVPRLYGWVYKIIRLGNKTAEGSVVVVAAGYQSGESQVGSRGWSVFNSRFAKFVLGSIGSITFVILVDDSETGGPSSVTVRMEYSFAL